MLITVKGMPAGYHEVDRYALTKKFYIAMRTVEEFRLSDSCTEDRVAVCFVPDPDKLNTSFQYLFAEIDALVDGIEVTDALLQNIGHRVRGALKDYLKEVPSHRKLVPMPVGVLRVDLKVANQHGCCNSFE